MKLRRLPPSGSSLALAVLATLALAGLGVLAHARSGRKPAAWPAPAAGPRQLVRELGLTDLSLFTEARYARHLSQADLHSAFQDGPGALEHFPVGSLVRPARLYPASPASPADPVAGFVPAAR
jgi:hypothetical protein